MASKFLNIYVFSFFLSKISLVILDNFRFSTKNVMFLFLLCEKEVISCITTQNMPHMPPSWNIGDVKTWTSCDIRSQVVTNYVCVCACVCM